MRKNPNLVGLVNVKFGKIKIISICSQDTEQKRNFDGHNDAQMDGQNDARNDGQPKSCIAPLFQNKAIKV